jgi:hypothetical protein
MDVVVAKVWLEPAHSLQSARLTWSGKGENANVRRASGIYSFSFAILPCNFHSFSRRKVGPEAVFPEEIRTMSPYAKVVS